jgi:soluble lytic murein transglycosylase
VHAEPPVFAAPLPADVAFYAGLGFDAEAVAALRKQEAVVQASVPPGLGLPTLVRAYHALSEYARPRALVHQAPAGLLTSAPGPHNAWAFSAAYARPHATFVQARARVDGVDPELIYAVMLKESVFDPSVTSNADAIGLMQLLPGTGKAVGKSLGLHVTRQTLFDPRANIVLGTRLLKQLLARYSGQMPLAVAAYNAGEHRVDAWLVRARKKAQGAPIALDRFVEDIPIDQTRNYVRRVMAFYARYELLQAVLANEANPPVLTLPDAVF